ncbi:hypothetical protein MJM28_27995, partial [Salmonella enterica subsp. enterica serovar Montevideo]|nr:hypothetical protein [Salmonella enterica subsp. enterica serovar Montevideo]
RWIQQRIESGRAAFSADEKKRFLNELTAAEGLERYLGAKFPGDAVKFKDKTITGAKILGSVDLKDIQLERIDSSLVDSAQVEKKG